jgi:hypothetical protein
MRKLQRKQEGFIVTVELLFIVTILVIGLVVGWVQIRNATIAEMADTAEAIGAIDQGYSFPGTADPVALAFTQGSEFVDAADVGQGFNDDYAASLGNAGAGSIDVTIPPAGLE